ncbi:MAG: deoxyribodipyrimidine photo-lyase [Hyphomicrobiaceae bacterium]|nr:deoxyribodipyrimidine photo-lyase [Hyphomicrobiaceae bacterium]
MGPVMNVVWFKRDLRIVDHRPLAEAVLRGPVLPIVVIEIEWWQQPDMSARQFEFYRECIAELSIELWRLGVQLIVRVSDIISVLNDISRSQCITNLWSHEETGGDWTFRRDLKVRDWCRHHGVLWIEYRQDGVIRRLKNRDGWSGKWNKFMARSVIPAPARVSQLSNNIDNSALPKAEDLGLCQDYAPFRQHGGRSYALSMLHSFLHERGASYRVAMSSPIAGEIACSRLSTYLAWGALSLREVTQATWKRQKDLKQSRNEEIDKWRGSLVSFTGRLHWHCHFMQKLEDEPLLEFENLHSAYNKLRKPGETDRSRLNAWRNGETGLPFVDACMRYLDATGWLNFRMRAMLTAVSSYHLWLHWRLPGLHLARKFIDYEAGIHWPQTQMQSGTTGINTVRIYNPVKQGYDQDPDGEFVRRWVPELEEIDGAAIHEPWKIPSATSILDKKYPLPIIDHMDAAREARRKIYGTRKGPEFHQKAKAIQTKHGSRKNSTSVTKKGAHKLTKPTADEQLSIPFSCTSKID